MHPHWRPERKPALAHGRRPPHELVSKRVVRKLEICQTGRQRRSPAGACRIREKWEPGNEPFEPLERRLALFRVEETPEQRFGDSLQKPGLGIAGKLNLLYVSRVSRRKSGF